MQKYFNWRNPNSVLISLLFLTTLIFFSAMIIQTWLGFYARYMTDDFCTTARLNEDGFWQSQIYWYNNWSGRFVFTFLINLLGLMGLNIPRILPFFIVLVWTIAAYGFINALLENLKPIPWLFRIFLTLALMYISLYTLPNTGQILYWMTGSITYALPIILSLFLFIILLKNNNQINPYSKPGNFFIHGGVILLALMISGLGELTGVLLISILSAGLFYQRWISPVKKFSFLWALTLIAAIIGLIIVVAAPGNAIRQTYFPDPPGIFLLIINSAKYTISFALRYFVRNFHILFPLFLLTTFYTMFFFNKKSIVIPRTEIKKWSLFITICSSLLFFACFLPSTYAMSQPPPDRVSVFPIFITAITLQILGVISGIFLSESFQTKSKEHSNFLLVVFTILLFYFLANGPIYQARIRYGQRSNAREFAQIWDQQHQQILEDVAAGKKEIVVKPIQENFMEVIYVDPRPDFWLNLCFSDFYGVDSFRSIPIE